VLVEASFTYFTRFTHCDQAELQHIMLVCQFMYRSEGAIHVFLLFLSALAY
jgi:hypothetical protein